MKRTFLDDDLNEDVAAVTCLSDVCSLKYVVKFVSHLVSIH